MTAAVDSAEHNIIIVQDRELFFFEDFTKKNQIAWSYEDKKNHLLPLSKSYVGYITTPERTIPILPKYHEIGFEHIIRMYLYVYGYRPTDSAAILDISSSEASIDIADMFIENLKRNMREGIIRTYKRRAVHTSSLRGRINYTKTYLNAQLLKRNYVFSKVSKLSMDNNFNNLILSALYKLQHTKKYTAIATELSLYFDGAIPNITNGSAVLSHISFNSNTARYRKTLTFAAMIVDQLSYSDTGSTVGSSSFLINFDKLFENFIIKVLKEVPFKKEFSTWACKRPFAEIFSISGKCEERYYQPDILYRFIDEDIHYDYTPSAYAVLDVKNKAYGQFKNADVYQILTYAKLLHSKKAILLYPSFQRKTAEHLKLDSTVFSPSTISACFINIAATTGDEFLASIHYFIDTVIKILMDIPL